MPGWWRHPQDERPLLDLTMSAAAREKKRPISLENPMTVDVARSQRPSALARES